MKSKVNAPVIIVALAIIGAIFYGLYKFNFPDNPKYVNPSLSDIPPKDPAKDKPVTPPKDAGPVPGAMPR